MTKDELDQLFTAVLRAQLELNLKDYGSTRLVVRNDIIKELRKGATTIKHQYELIGINQFYEEVIIT